MEPTLLQIGKKAMSPEALEHPSNGFDVTLAGILGIDQDAVQVYDDKDVKLLG